MRRRRKTRRCQRIRKRKRMRRRRTRSKGLVIMAISVDGLEEVATIALVRSAPGLHKVKGFN